MTRLRAEGWIVRSARNGSIWPRKLRGTSGHRTAQRSTNPKPGNVAEKMRPVICRHDAWQQRPRTSTPPKSISRVPERRHSEELPVIIFPRTEICRPLALPLLGGPVVHLSSPRVCHGAMKFLHKNIIFACFHRGERGRSRTVSRKIFSRA